MNYKKQVEQFYPICDQERVDKKVIYHYIEDYPHNILTRDNEIAHMTSSGFIMNPSLTKVLVIFHKVYQAWGWTGGHTDGDVDLLEVALKEAREETGLTQLEPLSNQMMSIDILPVWGHMKKGSYVAAHLHLNASYVLIADENQPLVQNEVETEGVMWVSVEALEQYCDEPELVVVYKKLIERAKAYNPSLASEAPTSTTKNQESSFGQNIKDASISIAVHEAKSAYYKAKFVKEIAVQGKKGIEKSLGHLLKDKNKL